MRVRARVIMGMVIVIRVVFIAVIVMGMIVMAVIIMGMIVVGIRFRAVQMVAWKQCDTVHRRMDNETDRP